MKAAHVVNGLVVKEMRCVRLYLISGDSTAGKETSKAEDKRIYDYFRAVRGFNGFYNVRIEMNWKLGSAWVCPGKPAKPSSPAQLPELYEFKLKYWLMLYFSKSWSIQNVECQIPQTSCSTIWVPHVSSAAKGDPTDLTPLRNCGTVLWVQDAGLIYIISLICCVRVDGILNSCAECRRYDWGTFPRALWNRWARCLLTSQMQLGFCVLPFSWHDVVVQ